MPGTRVRDKIIIVSGGSGLLGKPMISHLLENGATVINADINVETDLVEGRMKCDISSEESVVQLIDSVLEKYGRIETKRFLFRLSPKN